MRTFPDVSRKAVRVVVYAGNSKLKTKLDQTWESGYAVGFQPLVAFVMSQLPQNEVVEEAIRRKVKLVPEIVIRELVANSLIHQDFSVTGASVMIEIYSNRVELSNPGEPIVPVERFIDGYQSRNERSRRSDAADAHLRGEEQWHRSGNQRGGDVPASRPGFRGRPQANERNYSGTSAVQGHGPRVAQSGRAINTASSGTSCGSR